MEQWDDGPWCDAGETKGLLQGGRTALISAAVTGKIDVHHWQPLAVLAQTEA